jgi:NTE family protein
MMLIHKYKALWILKTLLLMQLASAFASHCFGAEQPRRRIGLALSGGGARGAAQIGVLKVLEREGVRIDYIAGTSFGAIVGGLYAAGYSAEEIETFVLKHTQGIFNDQPQRTRAPLIQGQNLRQLLRLNMRGLVPGLPMGIMRGQKLTELLNQWTFDAVQAADYDFDRLPIPFRAVATDLLTGDPYIFKVGRLSEAIRASVSQPVYFSPVEKDGLLLVDGGLSNQLPTDILKEMGADIVIAVDTTSPDLLYKEVNNAVTVLSQSVSLLIRQTVKSHYQYAGLVIQPELDGFQHTSYSHMSEIIKHGIVAAEARAEEIRALVGKDNLLHERKPRDAIDPIIDSITFEPASPTSHLRKLPVSNLLRRIHAKPGDSVDPRKLGGDVQNLYATGMFDKVDYDCRRLSENRCSLVFLLTESASNTLGISARYDHEYRLQALMEATGRNLFGTSSYVTLSGRFGETGYEAATLRLVHPKLPFLFVEPQAQLVHDERFIKTPEGTVPFLDKRRGAQLMTGARFFGSLEVSAGYRFETGHFLRKDVQHVESTSMNLSGLQLRLRRDTLNAQEFPRSGMTLEFRIDSRMPKLGADLRYNTFQGEIQEYLSPTDKTTFILRLAAFQSGGNLPVFDKAYVGGYGFSASSSYRLAGFKRDELSVPKMVIGGMGYRRQLISSNPLGFVRKGYVSLEYNLAAIGNRPEISTWHETVHGGSIGFALDTLIGPIRMAAGMGQAGKLRLYLSLGPSF